MVWNVLSAFSIVKISLTMHVSLHVSCMISKHRRAPLRECAKNSRSEQWNRVVHDTELPHCLLQARTTVADTACL